MEPQGAAQLEAEGGSDQGRLEAATRRPRTASLRWRRGSLRRRRPGPRRSTTSAATPSSVTARRERRRRCVRGSWASTPRRRRPARTNPQRRPTAMTAWSIPRTSRPGAAWRRCLRRRGGSQIRSGLAELEAMARRRRQGGPPLRIFSNVKRPAPDRIWAGGSREEEAQAAHRATGQRRARGGRGGGSVGEGPASGGVPPDVEVKAERSHSMTRATVAVFSSSSFGMKMRRGGSRGWPGDEDEARQ